MGGFRVVEIVLRVVEGVFRVVMDILKVVGCWVRFGERLFCVVEGV